MRQLCQQIEVAAVQEDVEALVIALDRVSDAYPNVLKSLAAQLILPRFVLAFRIMVLY